MTGLEMIAFALSAPQLKADNVVFITSPEQIPCGTRCVHEGVEYVVTRWQYRTKTGRWKIGLVVR